MAFAPARSLTSHARRVYVSRYQGRFRFSAWVFGFDVFLLGVLVTLAVFNIAVFFTTTVPQDGGVEMKFSAGALRASEDIPIRVTLRANDLAVHEDVRLQWRLPDWVEIVRAEPRFASDGTVHFGRVTPGDDRYSLIVVRIRSMQGVDVPFDVVLHQRDRFGFHRITQGRETRPALSSAISAEMVLPISAAVSGSSIPIVVKNSGQSSLESAVFRVTEGIGTVAGGSSVFLGHLAPSSSRVVFVDIPSQKEVTTSTLTWQVEDQSRIIAAGSTVLSLRDEVLQFKIRSGVSADSREGELRVTYTLPKGSIGKILSVLVGTDESESFKVIDAVEGNHTVNFSELKSSASSSARWVVVPFVQLEDGGWAVGKRQTGAQATTIPFSAAVRYYSDAGDQIGVGPITPLVGQETRYWVVWTVDTGTEGLEDAILSGTLPPDVRATGNFASTVSGLFNSSGRNVSWSFRSLPPSNTSAPLTFAFEAILTPSKAAPIYPLIATSTIEALDATTGAALYSEAQGDDSRWRWDERAREVR